MKGMNGMCRGVELYKNFYTFLSLIKWAPHGKSLFLSALLETCSSGPLQLAFCWTGVNFGGQLSCDRFLITLLLSGQFYTRDILLLFSRDCWFFQGKVIICSPKGRTCTQEQPLLYSALTCSSAPSSFTGVNCSLL